AQAREEWAGKRTETPAPALAPRTAPVSPLSAHCQVDVLPFIADFIDPRPIDPRPAAPGAPALASRASVGMAGRDEHGRSSGASGACAAAKVVAECIHRATSPPKLRRTSPTEYRLADAGAETKNREAFLY